MKTERVLHRTRRLWRQCALFSLSMMASLFCGVVSAEVLHEEKSVYRNIFVTEVDGRRCLMFNAIRGERNQTCMDMRNPKEFVFHYARMTMAGLLVIGLLLGWAPVVELFERLLGWDLAGSVRPVVLWSLPYAFLRLANTIGRQRRLVHGELRGVVAWDVAGIAARSIILALVIAELGLVAFPLAAAAAELLQLGVWWGEGRRASA